MAGFEPAISCSRRPPLCGGARRNTRLSYILPASPRQIVQAVSQRTDLFGTLKSAQRESNPHFRHGKATGYRYIMGALWCVELSKINRAPGETRTLVAALRVRYPRRWTTSAITSVGPEELEPSLGGLRVRCAAANTLIPSSALLHAAVGAEGVEPSV